MLFQAIEVGAIVSSGIFGILLARQKRMDLVGIFCVSLMIAFGGGTLRDLFLDRHPLFWIKHSHYPVIIFALSLGSLFVPRPRFTETMTRWLELPDALGLGLFSVLGTAYGLEAGTTWFIASLLGVITGTFGGVIADVVCNEVPRLFTRSTPLYATCAFAGAWMFLLLQYAGLPETTASAGGIVTAVTLRLAALKWQWYLPGGEDHDAPAARL